MSQNSGEKELILGNKQLISLFFIVVALCGVFFAMGYMVRGNGLKANISSADDPGAVQAAATIKRQQPEPPRDASDSSPVPETTSPAIDTPPRIESQPAQEPTVTKAASSMTDPKPYQKTEASSVEVPETGATYVQVGALARPDAEATVRTLKEQHLPASVAASSKEGLFRVLVGPYHQTTDVADVKAKLKKLGFDTIVVKM